MQTKWESIQIELPQTDCHKTRCEQDRNVGGSKWYLCIQMEIRKVSERQFQEKKRHVRDKKVGMSRARIS